MKVGKYTIRWRHHRAEEYPRDTTTTLTFPVERECTTCIFEDGNKMDTSVAFCHPADNFCKDTGRRLSLARCMKDMKIPKEDREMIWEAYRDMTPKKRW